MLLALLAQPLGAIALCRMAMGECPSPGASHSCSHGLPAFQLTAADQTPCCQMQANPVAVLATMVGTAGIDLTSAAVTPAGPSDSSVRALLTRSWVYFDSLDFKELSRAQAFLCVFLV